MGEWQERDAVKTAEGKQKETLSDQEEQEARGWKPHGRCTCPQGWLSRGQAAATAVFLGKTLSTQPLCTRPM